MMDISHQQSTSSSSQDPMIGMMVEGKYEAFLATCSKKLEEIRSVVAAPDRIQNSSYSSSSPFYLESVPLPLLEESAMQRHHKEESPVILFNRAMVLHLRHEQQQAQSPTSSHRDIPQAAVLLYNVGLCHHAQALQSKQQEDVQKNRTSFLYKAQHFYTLAVTLLTAWQEDHDDEDDIMQGNDFQLEDEEALGLLRLALLNNLAAIHAYFMDLDQAMGCLEALEEEMEYLPLGETDTPGCVADDDFCFFTMACSLGRSGAASSRRQALVASPAA